MHHSVHIEAATQQPVSRVPLPATKAPDDGQFRETFGANLRPVAAPNSDGKGQPNEDASNAANWKLTARVIAPAQTGREPAKGDETAAPELSEAAKPAANAKAVAATPNTTVNAEDKEASIPALGTGVVAPKKSAHKDVAKASTDAEAATSDGAAPMPMPVQGNLPVALPIAVVAASQTGSDAPKIELSTSSCDVAAKASKGRGLTTAAQSSTPDAKKPEAGTTEPSTVTKPDAESQAVAISPQAIVHDAGHPGSVIEQQGIGVMPVTAGHGPTAAGSSSVARTSEAGSAQALSDAGSQSGSQATDLQTLVATPNVLEVGIASGSHGWLRVRAEFGQTGEVAASMVAASAGAAQGLHKELPALSAYLAGERVGVSSLVVNAAEKSAGAQDSVLNNGAGSAGGSQSGTNQRGQDVPASPASAATSDSDNFGLDTDAGFALAGMNLPTVIHANGSGSWLSVRV